MDSSDLSEQAPNNSFSTLQLHKNNQTGKTDLYQSIINFDKYKEVSSHIQHNKMLRKFIVNSMYKVLFIFGPSGSGKHLLVKNMLVKNKLPYEQKGEKLLRADYDDRQYEMQDENKFYKVLPLKDQILESLNSSYANLIEIYEDFPITSLDNSSTQINKNVIFKKNFYSSIRQAKCKIIFILNSEIYNSFYIESSEYHEQILSIKIKPYTNTENKSILKHFTTFYSDFSYILTSKDELDEVIEVANGDARRLLLNVYLNYIQRAIYKPKKRFFSKIQKAEQQIKLKNEKKIPLFHLLGKFLYAKRLDIKTMKDRAFSREQLDMDPPFYFDPVWIYQKSGIPLTIFSELIFENYLQRYGSIRDCQKMAEIFKYLDSRYTIFMTKKNGTQSSQKSLQIYLFLLTWGIILKNKDVSLNKKGFVSFRRSRSNIIRRQSQLKKNIVHKYMNNKISLSSWVKFAYMLRNFASKKPYMISQIINPNLSSAKNSASYKMTLNEETLAVSEQQQDLLQISSKNFNENEIKKAIADSNQKKEKHQKMLKEMMIEIEDQQESDIDSV